MKLWWICREGKFPNIAIDLTGQRLGYRLRLAWSSQFILYLGTQKRLLWWGSKAEEYPFLTGAAK